MLAGAKFDKLGKERLKLNEVGEGKTNNSTKKNEKLEKDERNALGKSYDLVFWLFLAFFGFFWLFFSDFSDFSEILVFLRF